ncbi:MAG: hypothetical protein AB1424_11925 [Thermodesulfobacteriota bacterium]
MEMADYLAEAAKALRLPEEFWPNVSGISFDVGDQEWYSACHVSGEMISPEAHAWVLKLIGWLQFNYPQGPAFPEASCC